MLDPNPNFGKFHDFLRLPFSLKLILFYYVNMAIFDNESTLMTGSYFVSAIHVEKWLFLVSIIARMSPQYFDLNIVKFTCNLSNYDLLDLENILRSSFQFAIGTMNCIHCFLTAQPLVLELGPL